MKVYGLVLCMMFMWFKRCIESSCTREATYCEIGHVCRLQLPNNITQQNISKFVLEPSQTEVPNRNGLFTFIPNQSVIDVASLFHSNETLLCKSTVIIYDRPVKVQNISCTVDKNQNNLVCTILDDIDKLGITVTINSNKTERICVLSSGIFNCSFEYNERFQIHAIRLSTFNEKVPNTLPRTAEFPISIVSSALPSPLSNMSSYDIECFSMSIRAEVIDDFILNERSIVKFEIVVTDEYFNSTKYIIKSARNHLDHRLDHLYGYTVYNISVRWAISGGRTWSNWTQITQKTLACAPTAAPSLLPGGYSITDNNQLAIYWTKIPPRFENGPDLKYEIYRLPSKNKVELQTFPTFKTLEEFGNLIKLKSVEENVTCTSLSRIDEGDVVIINSKNSESSSQNYDYTSISEITDRGNKWLNVEPLNDTHLRLNWYLGNTRLNHIHIYWCYGSFWSDDGWVDCKESIHMENTVNESSYDLAIPIRASDFKCHQCYWQYSISESNSSYSSPLLWNRTISAVSSIPIPVASSTTYTGVFVTIILIVFILSILVAFYLIFRFKRSCECSIYDIHSLRYESPLKCFPMYRQEICSTDLDTSEETVLDSSSETHSSASTNGDETVSSKAGSSESKSSCLIIIDSNSNETNDYNVFSTENTTSKSLHTDFRSQTYS